MKERDKLKFKKMGFTDKQLNKYRQIDYSKLTKEQRKAIDGYIRRQNSIVAVWVFIVLFLPWVLMLGYQFLMEFVEGGENVGQLGIIFLGVIVVAGIMISYLLKDERGHKKRTDRLKKISQELVTYENYDGVEGLISGKEFDLIDENHDGKIMVHEFYPLTEQEVVEKILNVDENFSITELKTYVKNVFLLIQEAFTTKNYRKLRAFESDILFNQHKLYITSLINCNELDEKDDVNIKGVLLKDFKIEGRKQVLVVALTTGMKKNLSNRFSTCEGDVPYILTFMRKKGIKTKIDTELSTSNCSNCGAVINVDSNGVCKYCNTSLVSGDLEWVLVDIKNIALGKNK